MSEKNISRDFARRILPWIIALGALILYLFTVNPWISVSSLPSLARLERWDWTIQATNPVYFILTWPLRLLSGTTHFVALNLFSVLCGALTLALLARCVSLLPHDRTRDQRQREGHELSLLSLRFNWVAPLAAVLALAFQFTFWEHATTATGEMFDLLIFAYVIRCLLEFRVSRNENWLVKLAFVYGLGITNNWAMIGFFPLFLTALLWIKGLSIFNSRFFLRMVLFGLAGLSFYLVLPLLELFSARSNASFWETLRSNLAHQKSFLVSLPFVRFPELRAHLFVMSLSSLLPLLFISIRWPAFQGDVNPAASFLTSLMFRVLHLVFLVVCMWGMFDPKFSPRALSYGFMPFLTFYFLSALCVGYLVGYIMLIFGRAPETRLTRPKPGLESIQRGIAVVAALVALAVPFWLLAKNLPSIRAGNGPILLRFANHLTQTLPKEESILLSDEPIRIYLLKALQASGDQPLKHLFIDTHSWGNSNYHAFLWKTDSAYKKAVSEPPKDLSPASLIQILQALGKDRPLIYLHPSFGYFFEWFYMEPHGLTYALKPLPSESVMPPPLPAETIAQNESFWDTVKSQIADIPRWSQKNEEAMRIASFYSRSLNYWAVELQKLNRLDVAKKRFEDALLVNPENVHAEINLMFNEQLSRGEIKPVPANEKLQGKLRQYRSWQDALTVNGPFDELDGLQQMGELFATGGNLRQSVQFFTRALQLQPTRLPAQVGLAKSSLDLGEADKALKLAAAARQQMKKQPANFKPGSEVLRNLEFELLRLEVGAYAVKEDFAVAQELLVNAAQEQPKNEKIAALLKDFYFQSAVYQMQNNQPEQAVATLNTLLKSEPSNTAAYLNRAIAYLTMNKLDEARADYLKVAKLAPRPVYQVHYGLGEIAFRQKNKAEAVNNYKLYLANAPTNSAEYQKITDQVKELEGRGAK